MAMWKVLHGRHSEGGKTYQRGDIVDSKSDLSKMNSPGAMKFELIGESLAPSPPSGSGKPSGSKHR